MTKNISAIMAISVLGVWAAPSYADMYKSSDVGLYAGGNYTFVNVDGNGFDADLGTLSGKVGANVTPFLGLEARAGFGVDDDTQNGVELSADNFFGGYATLNLANESPATPYAIFGFTRYELEAQSFFGTVSDSESDFSYGLGVNLALSEELSGNIEYMRYFDKDDVTIDGIGLGLTVNF
ncbi:porin family protein [Marinobacter caseinilyticus]|uniref:porin family protein n=1 Tax=Marinobacter caseinilyticus TaxID=2692195 RepID=UPI001409ED91|nr:porin family protein [Marinobacter caseinilyticus]